MNDLVLRNITEERTDKLQEQSIGQDGIASREGKNEWPQKLSEAMIMGQFSSS